MTVDARQSRLMVIGLVTLLVICAGAPLASAQELSPAQPAGSTQEPTGAKQAESRQESAVEKPAEEHADDPDKEHKPHADIVVARTLAELPAVVKPGETVYVTDASGVRNKFRMQGVSADASSVLLERNGAILELSEDQVLNMSVRRGDRLWDGAVKGALIGASPFVVVAIVCAAVDSCGSEAMAASLFGGLIGAGIGVGIDASFKETHLVYSAAPPAARPKVALAPLISGQRKGAVVQINF